MDHDQKVAPRALGTHWARKPPGGGFDLAKVRVDLVAPYSNHLDALKTTQTVLARSGPGTSITDEPDLGLLG